jgi:hypothetical protein
LIDVTGLAVSGYQATDWLRAERAVDLGMSDHRRIGYLTTENYSRASPVEDGRSRVDVQ